MMLCIIVSSANMLGSEATTIDTAAVQHFIFFLRKCNFISNPNYFHLLAMH